MKTAIVTAKIDPKLKASVERAARDLGVSLSFVINHSLRKFSEEKTIELIPNEETIAAIEEARRDRENGKGNPSFDNPEDFIRHLDNL